MENKGELVNKCEVSARPFPYQVFFEFAVFQHKMGFNDGERCPAFARRQHRRDCRFGISGFPAIFSHPQGFFPLTPC